MAVATAAALKLRFSDVDAGDGGKKLFGRQ